VNGVEQQIERCKWKFQATELTKNHSIDGSYNLLLQ